MPEFLDSQHTIAVPADAESYLERLQAYARALEGETARLRHDSLLSREIGASYIERNWPPALKESGAWPLASLKASVWPIQNSSSPVAPRAAPPEPGLSLVTLEPTCGRDRQQRSAMSLEPARNITVRMTLARIPSGPP